MQDGEGEPCGKCGKPARSNAKLHTCTTCNHRFHSTCTKLHPVTLAGGRSGRVCGDCLAAGDPAKKTDLPASLAADSGSLTIDSRRESPPQRGDLTIDVPESTLERILGRLDVLDSLETRFTAFESTLKDVREGLAVLPAITASLKALKGEVGDVREDLKVLREEHDSLVARVNSGTPTENPETTERLKTLEEQNVDLRARVASVSSQKSSSSHSTSSALIVGGISTTLVEEQPLKQLALAIFSPLYPDIERKDIISVRFLKPRVRRRDSRSGEEQSLLDSPSSGSSGRRSRRARRERPPALLVTLKSSALAEEVLRRKIQHGVLHTRDLTGPHLVATGAPPPPPSNITINEFLPGEVHRLHVKVRTSARKSRGKFISFIRDGQICVRRKKSDALTVISSEVDLDRFLGTM